MAITLVQTPANVLKAGQRIIYTASSSNVSETGFKFFVQVYEGSDELYSAYISPNPSDYLVFDLGNIAKSLVKPLTSEGADNPIHGTVNVSGRAFKKGNNINRLLQVRVGEVYESSGVLTEYPDLQNQDVHIIDGWDKPSDGYGKLLATDDFGATKKGWATDRIESTKTPPNHISVTGLHGEIYIGAAETDWGTTGFYNNQNTSPGINTLTDQIHYEVFNPAGSSLGSTTITLNSSTHSGLPTSTDIEDKLVIMDTYPANISAAVNAISVAAVSPAYFLYWDYYVLTPQTSGGVETGAKLVVFKEDANCKHKRHTLGWQNSFGTYDYLPFTGRAEHEIKRTSKKFNTFLGDYDGTTFDFGSHERQEAEYSVRANKYIKVSNYFTEGEFMILQNAMVSKEVVLIESSVDSNGQIVSVIPVTLETNSMKVHEELESKMKDVTLNLKVSQTYAFS